MGKDNDQSFDGKDGRPRIKTDGLLDRLQEHGRRAIERLHEQDRERELKPRRPPTPARRHMLDKMDPGGGPVIIEQPKG